MGGCAYIIASTFTLQRLYNGYIVLGIHGLLSLFWVIVLGLVANLAHIWAEPNYCYGYVCLYYKRDLSHLAKRDTTVGAYYGALCAGAVFAAAELVMWVASAVLVILYLNKRRGDNTATQPSVAPANVAPTQDIPLDQKYDYAFHQQQQQQSYPPTPQQYPAQPYVDQQQHAGFNANPYPQYHQDPIHRGDTVSPVSSVGYGHNPQVPAGNANELSATPYTPNLPELSQHK